MPRKHPSGLPFLFLTEMWERFGYYLMIGIFQLYLTDPLSTGGMAMDRKDAADIYGTFIASSSSPPSWAGCWPTGCWATRAASSWAAR